MLQAVLLYIISNTFSICLTSYKIGTPDWIVPIYRYAYIWTAIAYSPKKVLLRKTHEISSNHISTSNTIIWKSGNLETFQAAVDISRNILPRDSWYNSRFLIWKVDKHLANCSALYESVSILKYEARSSSYSKTKLCPPHLYTLRRTKST